MFRPSNRRRTSHEGIELNLIPMMDAMVTLIAFLLFSMSMLSIVAVDSFLPIASKSINELKAKNAPLQLSIVVHEDQTKIWSPFYPKISKIIPHFKNGAPDSIKIHDSLVEIKKMYPHERQVVITPRNSTSYDSIISVMDAARNFDSLDPPVYIQDSSGVTRQTQDLFPEIVFSNLLGGP